MNVGQANAQVRLSTEEAEKLLLDAPLALYPEIAKVARAKGLVKVEISVSDQGFVTSAKAISGHPLLQSAAVGAVKKRKYHPYMVGNRTVPFTTIVEMFFPPGATKEEKLEHERQDELAKQYYKEDERCRDLAKRGRWTEAEKTCRAVLRIAYQLSDDRYMEKMGSNEILGHVLLNQKRYPEAVEFYKHAISVVETKLTLEDAELGRLYGDLAIAHHLMRDLQSARELYRKAETIYQSACVSIGKGGSDEWVESVKQDYRKALKKLLEYHLAAAQDSGEISEEQEIRKTLKSLEQER